MTCKKVIWFWRN